MNTLVYDSGTGLLLRLCKDLEGSGRLIVADSAFASVKACVALKTHLGLYFHGLVKTSHKQFPKGYLQTLPMTARGEHKVVTTIV